MNIQLIDGFWYNGTTAIAPATATAEEMEALAPEYDMFVGYHTGDENVFRAVAGAIRRRQTVIDTRNAAQAALNEPPIYCISGDCLDTNLNGIDRLHFRQVTCPDYNVNDLYTYTVIADALL